MPRVTPVIVLLVLAALPSLMPPQKALAQTATGSILGSVKDQTGAVVPGVTVTIKSAATGTTRIVSTTESGVYSAIALLPGDYVLSFDAAGFGKGTLDVSVAVGVTTNADFVMPLASQQTKVVVAENAAGVNTAQAVVEDVLTTEQIEQ
ncbi:MAG: carboxypeptidase regulatory-like domain-containing protein, partial [Acidobacteria bacterium]|nr:carboxypeptidase regulatory-like domain-containing protein [Acidobacteriota bacterium]